MRSNKFCIELFNRDIIYPYKSTVFSSFNIRLFSFLHPPYLYSNLFSHFSFLFSFHYSPFHFFFHFIFFPYFFKSFFFFLNFSPLLLIFFFNIIILLIIITIFFFTTLKQCNNSGCVDNDNFYSNGESWKSNACTECYCQKGQK